MDSLGVGIIGAGTWGINHAKSFHELDEVDLLAICDINPARAMEAARLFGVTPYTNVDDVLKRKDIKAVSVCTWSASLADVTIRALEAGKHVLVEKPMAVNSYEANHLMETAKREGLNLAVGFLTRFTVGFQHIKKLIDNKEIGSLVCATATRVSKWPERIGDVGVVKDLAIHDIDIMRCLFNSDPMALYARTGRARHKEYEDYSQIMLAFGNGRSALIESNWLTPHKTRTLTVTGTEAIVRLDHVTEQLTVSGNAGEKKVDCTTQNPLKLELQHFVSCIQKNAEQVAGGIDGLRALQIAEAALKSSEDGVAINL